ncbi:MAG: hypothetical protein JXA10_08085 [Anaerolineae bacterium]|nr:hypothetical protein [Anaerolineae bacterium]
MSVPPPSHNQHGQGSRPTPAEYEQLVRAQGYTVPYQKPPEPPKPPKGMVRRSVKQYSDLRKQAQASSMAWWGAKATQGCLLGTIPITFGLVLTGAYVLTGGSISWAVLGILLLVGGLAVTGWYSAAPWTRKWIVNVSENGYWVVEDGNGHTAEYLPPGRMIVPFRMNSKVLKYVNFQAITIREAYDDVLRGTGRKVDLEIKVAMIFNPVEADPRFYGRLRTMTQKEQFENVVRNSVRDAVSQYFTRLSPAFWEMGLQNPKVLEDAIIDHLAGLESMGLFWGSRQPVTVFVHGITISSGAANIPLDPELFKRDPFDLTPPPTPTEPKKAPVQRAQPATQGDARFERPQDLPRSQPLQQSQGARRYDLRAQHNTPPPAPSQRAAAPLPQQQPTPQPLNWEPSINEQTMPHIPAGNTNYAAPPQSQVPPAQQAQPTQRQQQPAFIPGAINLGIDDDDTDIDTLLKRVQDNPNLLPRENRRAKPTDDQPRPKTTRPDFWIRGRNNDGA